MKLGSCGDPAGARLGVEKGVTGLGAAAEGCPEEKTVNLCIKKTFRKEIMSLVLKNIENFSNAKFIRICKA